MNYKNNCRCCGNTNLTEWLSLPESPVANLFVDKPVYEKHPLDLLYCSDCGHLQLETAPDPSPVFRTYTYMSGVSNSFRNHFTKYANDVSTYLNKSSGNLLEVGSNDGYLISEFKKLGWDVIGVEPAKTLAEKHADYGVPVVTDFFTTDTVTNKKWNSHFDVVCANNVLAHIPNIHNVIAAISNSLKDNGILVAECGNQEGIIFGFALDNVYHEHIDYYSPYSFSVLLEQYGLKVIRVETLNTHGSSFRAYAIKDSSAEKTTEFVQYDMEEKRETIVDMIAERQQKMNQQLRGRNFVAYGAAAKAVTAIYTLGLADSITAVVDDSELKQNKFFPGTNVKVIPSSKLDKDALVVITAWNVYQDIKTKLEDMGHKGEILCLA
jgi:SAM-dependent methyltransferase